MGLTADIDIVQELLTLMGPQALELTISKEALNKRSMTKSYNSTDCEADVSSYNSKSQRSDSVKASDKQSERIYEYLRKGGSKREKDESEDSENNEKGAEFVGYDGSGSEGSAGSTEETFLQAIQSDLSKLKIDEDEELTPQASRKKNSVNTKAEKKLEQRELIKAQKSKRLE